MDVDQLNNLFVVGEASCSCLASGQHSRSTHGQWVSDNDIVLCVDGLWTVNFTGLQCIGKVKKFRIPFSKIYTAQILSFGYAHCPWEICLETCLSFFLTKFKMADESQATLKSLNCFAESNLPWPYVD